METAMLLRGTVIHYSNGRGFAYCGLRLLGRTVFFNLESNATPVCSRCKKIDTAFKSRK